MIKWKSLPRHFGANPVFTGKYTLLFITTLMLIVFGCSSEEETPEKDISEPAVPVEEATAEEARLAEEAAAEEEKEVEALPVEEATTEEAAELAAKKVADEKAAAAKKAAAEKALATEKAAAEQDLACQETYNLSQEKYRAGKYEETVTILEKLLQMEGCDEELSARAQYYIGWNYGDKQFKLDAAKEAYQKVVENYTSGLKYVEKSKIRLAHYKMSDEADAVYYEDDFQKAVELREKVAQLEEKKSDKELRAKNQYFAGYIYQFKLKKLDEAKEAYQKVIDNYAGSKYADKAEAKIKAFQQQ